MSSHESTRFPKEALARYAEIVLRHVYQSGGRDRFVPVREIEDAVGLEEDLVLELCRTRLLGEIQVADRLPAELEDDDGCRTPLELERLRLWFERPHVRIRPEPVRLTEDELLRGGKEREKRKKKRKKKRRGSRA
jgi:hypothetical protein